MKIRIWAITICLLLACSMCFANDMKTGATDNISGEENALTTHTNVDYLTFSVMLKKQTFIQDEPIEAKFSLTNNADHQCRLAEPAISGISVFFRIYQLEGKSPMPKQPEVDFGGPPRDYGWLFSPGETKFSYGNVLEKYPITLPPGRYAIEATYFADKHRFNQLDWYGTISVPPIEFNIIEPSTFQEAEARRIYLETIDKRSRNKSVIGMYSKIEKLGNVGLFTKYVEFMESMEYCNESNVDEFKIRIIRYRNKYGEYDINTIDGLRRLGSILQKQGNYLEARKMYELLPEGYCRSLRIKLCDMKLAELAESSKQK